MGLFGKVQGVFAKAQSKQIDSWLETATLEDLEAMEKQGVDVSEWKAHIIARDSAASGDQVEGTDAEASDESRFENPVDLGKLLVFKDTPRKTDSEFVKAVAGKLPLFGKEKHLQSVANGKLLFAGIVQANTDLWQPGENDFLPAVIVFALDEAHSLNIEWLNEMAAKIAEMKDADDIPADCSQFIETLRDDQSDFCFKLPPALSNGADAWCSVYKFEEQALLPRKCLPSEGVVPFILKEGPEENLGVWFHDIPGDVYIA